MDVDTRNATTLRVLELLDESFRAYQGDDHARFTRALNDAMELDVHAVSIVQGGMIIGEIPHPERDPQGWAEYLEAAREQLGQPA